MRLFPPCIIVFKLTRRFDAAMTSLKLLILRAGGCVSAGRSATVARHARILASDGGRIRLGDDATVACFADLEAEGAELIIDARSFVGQGCLICAIDSIPIGSDCLIAEHVTIHDQDHIYDRAEPTSTS